MNFNYPKNHKDFFLFDGVESIELVLKVTERCNIACKYCYYFFGGDESPLSRKPIFSSAKMHELVSFLERSIEFGLKRVRVVLHGGEPLLIKKEYLNGLLATMTDALSGKIELSFTIQTNATLIDDEWIDIFVKYKVFVGVSIDGPEEYNDLYRIDFSGKGTHSRVLQGIKLLFAAHEKGLMPKPGMIAVVNPSFSAKRIYNHLTKELNFDSLHFLLPDDTHDTFNESEQSKFTSFLLELIECWASDTDKSKTIRFVNEALDKLKQSVFQRNIIGNYNKVRRHILTIDSDGSIGPEDTLRSIAPHLFETGLNISDSSSYDVATNPTMITALEKLVDIPKHCKGCDWETICAGGSLKNRFSSKDSELFDRPSVYCDTLKEVYTTLAAYLISSGFSEEKLIYNISGNSQ
ncbi:radical SAM protein [Pseudoalteromonas sp. M8]|uniref:radical SAM protein n=1 Tax=Pseudoalteromonas sp. M8 TaxID=2692624 RepID=UPI001BA7248D|nr:radical SAM protein [Pseudoalteromonas sp. M8]QUI72446.1 radical SAM protein [Pseudoalteromonas sp. M8]